MTQTARSAVIQILYTEEDANEAVPLRAHRARMLRFRGGLRCRRAGNYARARLGRNGGMAGADLHGGGRTPPHLFGMQPIGAHPHPRARA